VKLVYVAGAPASGKSTLMNALTRKCRRQAVLGELPHDRLYREDWLVAAEVGRRRPDFPGTDTLAFNIMPKAKHWINNAMYGLVLGEGDRLAKLPFLEAAADSGYQVHLAMLDAPDWLLDERCEARGSHQNPTWRKGRLTAAHNLADAAEAVGIHVQRLNAQLPSWELVGQLHDAIPELAILEREHVRS
jgi:energy-coupling factor transporter ATP-binding protein EcfA2